MVLKSASSGGSHSFCPPGYLRISRALSSAVVPQLGRLGQRTGHSEGEGGLDLSEVHWAMSATRWGEGEGSQEFTQATQEEPALGEFIIGNEQSTARCCRALPGCTTVLSSHGHEYLSVVGVAVDVILDMKALFQKARMRSKPVHALESTCRLSVSLSRFLCCISAVCRDLDDPYFSIHHTLILPSRNLLCVSLCASRLHPALTPLTGPI